MKTIIKITTALFLFLAVGTLDAQQLPMYSQYMLNDFLLNPAIAGSREYSPIRVTSRQQWVGITGAPRTQALSGYTRILNSNVGLGGYIFNDVFGPLQRTGVQISYAYHLKLNSRGDQLSFGLSGTAMQFKLDERNLTLAEENDDAISYGIEKAFIPDANFGIYYYGKNFYAGVAGTQLFEYGFALGENKNRVNETARHYYAGFGYYFRLSEDIHLEPSIQLKMTEITPLQFDLNSRLFLKENFWLGASYRIDDAIIGMIGIRVNEFIFGYAYDYTISNLGNYTSGSHEIMLGINLGDPYNRIKSPRYL